MSNVMKLSRKREVYKLNKYIDTSNYDHIVDYDCDLYDKDTGKLVFLFRKSVVDNKLIENAFKGVETHSKKTSGLRGTATDKGRAMSNILGYFIDGMSLRHVNKKYGINKPFLSNISQYNRQNELQFNQNVYPLIKQLSNLYEEYLPNDFKEHIKVAETTDFHIKDTPFSTITINRDFQTAIHTDKNNHKVGYGNLIVYEGQEYEGAELCFPYYKIAVDVRQGDILFMNQHEEHGNTELIKIDKDEVGRVSFVSYLHGQIVNDKHKENGERYTLDDYYKYLEELYRKKNIRIL